MVQIYVILRYESLRDKIGMVLQDNILFSDSVLANILLGKPGASREEVIEAAKAANAHEFIMNLPDGYDTKVGERGVKLSGGQKQRIAIARVFLKNPPILILDEATSALDLESEHQIQETLEILAKDRTTLIVAHRLSTITHADRIILIEHGEIVEVRQPFGINGGKRDIIPRCFGTADWVNHVAGLYSRERKKQPEAAFLLRIMQFSFNFVESCENDFSTARMVSSISSSV